MVEFEEGLIFVEVYPPEAALWCNKHGFCLKELVTRTGVRHFQIARVLEPSKEEITNARLAEFQQYLDSTDWYTVRFAETGIPIPDDVRKKRQGAREAIDDLRAVLVSMATVQTET